MEKDKIHSLETDLKDENFKEETEIKEETLEQAEKKEDEEFEGISKESKDESKDESIIDNIKEENKKLKNELDTLQDRLVRTVAEYDNYRKRTSKEKEGIYSDACEDVLKEVLPVLDNLERALLADGNIDDLKKGVEMTLKQFNDALEKLGVEEISTKEGFDPNIHNAVMHIEDENFGENEVVEVFQKGYKRGEKVIRYSMVKVAN
ncbi:molecular chaperone GrpE [Clostridium tetanomorphum]|uniref:Protein GrpE n=1 Tax=Clostridium tetanomorphum TaxID=1553 RepID=A0A923E9T4_CLOTT|nr:nucleotide exchange factor GrpE [Clostridium tetanomorphum]KAJ53852.1 heat shock protein GrpE [Clostridium tetanomorphum DSM 665]MBC2397366.1 nucleotide exchange factor GrpE [Clostridium tetanomorphum]MBP1862586.1 molecular chaperone GrpE [Clostridium tetanomorphum]NRS85573.1 molecular chaperone GrpE [Clostridium tetanomorphum]NRZ96416.1 molecular chaperone GrpE [Clostridium tetanomorphum]